MNTDSPFQIDYIDPDGYINFPVQKKKSLKRLKYLGVLVYLIMLAVSPFLIYLLGTETPEPIKAVSSTSTSVFEERQTNGKTTEAKVIKNDSYWRISKRHCGEGRHYLSIKDANLGKALFEGDTVVINCSL